ncbi:hypothetical protein JYU34_006550 [Plutella xylostella]|uniref:Uncharacterized protein n=1 Tax=Plutella xylostella TaxID=51655 RepID=A0ABQ7QSD0_PLUXY|nr:uncharacterized protein LOC105393885 [Plutella xylostella]KAG7307934.1 hypothetical protein JYU34_006550 [Plutella xylostella]
MQFCISTSVLCLLLVLVAGQTHHEEECFVPDCYGEEYTCVKERCYCANGFVLSPFRTSCIRCPGLGEQCHSRCCSWPGEESLQCFQGTCQQCYDHRGHWICRDSVDSMIIITVPQIAVGVAIILGVVVTLLLLTKLCSVQNARRPDDLNSRLSIGSLQLRVDERLRDAPPRYTRTPPPGVTVVPYFVNAGFIHDSSIPPPLYSEVAANKNDITTNPAVHI